MPSIILALLLVVAGLGYVAWSLAHSHTNEAPRIIPITPPPPAWPKPLSRRIHEDDPTAAMERAPWILRAQGQITRGGEWR